MDTILFAAAILAVVLAVAAFLILEDRKEGATVFAGFTFIGAVLIALSVTYTLGANEVGIEVNRGRIGSTQGPGGWHTKAPWTKVEKLTVLPYTADPVDIAMRNGDGGEFSARFIIRWHTDADRAVTLYQQTRTDDEGDITTRIIRPLLAGVASDLANTYGNDSTLDAAGKVARQGVASASPLTFGRQVRDALAPLVAAKGILLDEVAIDGAFTLSDKMRAQLDALAASKARTQVALQDEQTAKAEAAAAAERAKAANSIPALGAQQVQVYCAQLWAAEARRATEKGVPLYTSPCGDGETSILVGAGDRP